MSSHGIFSCCLKNSFNDGHVLGLRRLIYKILYICWLSREWFKIGSWLFTHLCKFENVTSPLRANTDRIHVLLLLIVHTSAQYNVRSLSISRLYSYSFVYHLDRLASMFGDIILVKSLFNFWVLRNSFLITGCSCTWSNSILSFLFSFMLRYSIRIVLLF